MGRRHRLWVLGLVFAVACGGEPTPTVEVGPDADAQGHSAPTSATVAANAAVAEALPLEDPVDFEDAERGLLLRDENVEVAGPAGSASWNTAEYAFIDGQAPPSVNPSLWRQARLNNLHGLYEVVPGVYQVRGYDLSNLTLIEGQSGWIVVDPLTTAETAAAAMELAARHFGARKVSAVIFTHSHVDHFGGVSGVMPLAEGEIPIVAPAGFVEEATSENVLAGIAMARRATYMYGRRLARSERGHVDSGLGKTPAYGTVGIRSPNRLVDRTPQEMTLDGVRFVFQYAPESEAPAELTFYLPDKQAFCGAEIVSHTMHNLYTLRGAKVRDALRWAGYVDEALRLFPEAEVMFASHHWPMWGNARIRDYLAKQRDTYKFIHDQTLRFANQGLTPKEIADRLELPSTLAPSFPNRGYYGTVRHNSRAVYQWYFGWYDANPAHLNPHPPAQEARRYVEYMGGAASVLERAQVSFDEGDYRWVATVLDHVVFADPGNAEARALLARTYDQLGYQAESGPWRDVYLSAAYELRHGGPDPGEALSLAIAAELLANTPMERFLEAVAARVKGEEADGKQMKLNFVFPDVGESYVLTLENAVLRHRAAEPDPDASVTVRITKDLMVRLMTGQAGIREVVMGDALDIEGSRLELLSFFGLLDAPDPTFAIVWP
ncbi:MAG: alkyl sulfatase dimerization domain-containing protein [Myxococcota bacterium]|nr:alkyl sulfatase dimerization domain-containing protein [Myxococcota bacterium]